MINAFLSTGKEYGNVSSFNLAGVHARYVHVLKLLKKSDVPLAEALRQAKVTRNTFRDFLGLAELQILNERKYDYTIQRARREMAKPSVKDLERACQLEVLKYYNENNMRFSWQQKHVLKHLSEILDPNKFYWIG